MPTASVSRNLEGVAMNRYVLLILALPIVGVADNPFACVESDFAEAFLDEWYKERPTYSTSKPDKLVDIKLPEQFKLVGSNVTTFEFTVIYKTKAGANHAFSSVMDALEEDGWTNMADIRLMQQAVFRSHSMPTMAVVCRDDQPGILAIAFEQKSEQTFLSFSGYHVLPESPGTLGIGCNFVAPKPNAISEILRSNLPVLILPDDAREHGSGQSDRGDEVHLRIVFSTTMSRQELLDHFADQLHEQAWAIDSNWSGKQAAGSMWSFEPPNAGTLIGELHISGSANDAYRVRFVVWPAVGRDAVARKREEYFLIPSN